MEAIEYVTISYYWISEYPPVFVYIKFVFLNQAHAGLLPACAWFLRIALSANVCMRVCVCVLPLGY